MIKQVEEVIDEPPRQFQIEVIDSLRKVSYMRANAQN